MDTGCCCANNYVPVQSTLKQLSKNVKHALRACIHINESGGGGGGGGGEDSR